MRAVARFRSRPSLRAAAPAVVAALLALLPPAVATAGWGTESWGQMVWGGAPLANAPLTSVPAMPIEGIAGLAVLLLALAYWLLASRRKRAKHPTLHS